MTVVRLLFPGAPCADPGWTSGKQTLPRVYQSFNGGEGGRNPETLKGSLTECVSSRRVAWSPGGAVHVCSFSPALRLESADPSTPRRPSSVPNSACSLLASLPSRWSAEPRADASKPSERIIRDTRLMFTRRPCNFEVGHKLFSSQRTPPHHQKHLH